MSNYDERGAYSPRNEEPLAFDARYPRGGERRPPPTALILSVAVLLLLAAGVFFYYRSGIRSQNEPPRVLGQPVGEMVSPPPASSQPADPTASLEIYRGEQPAPAAAAEPTFAPEPEQPVARPEAPAPTPAPPPAARAEAVPLRPAQPAPAAPAPVRPKPAAVKPAPAPVKPATASAKPATSRATAGATSATTGATAGATVAPVVAPKPAAAGGPAAVQIGAFSDASQADKGWNDVARVLPGDMAGRGKRVEKADVNGATFHRTYVTGFASKAEAQAFCGKLRAAGKTCIVR